MGSSQCDIINFNAGDLKGFVKNKFSRSFEKENIEKLKDFTALQMRNYLEENFNYDVVRCVANNNELNAYLLFEKAKAVEKIKIGEL